MSSTKSPPQVSVIMSVYNGESFLSEAIASILNQTFSDFEFIIINDGSTDNSKNSILSFQDPRIRYVEQENNGLTASLNTAIQLATGTFIARQDADDTSLPTRLELQYAFMQQHPDYGLVGSQYNVMSETGVLLSQTPQPQLHSNEELQKILPRINPICHSSAFFRKDLVQKLGGYNPRFRFAQDYDLWLRLAKVTKLHCLKDVLVYRREQPNAIGSRHLHRQINAVLKIKWAHRAKLTPLDWSFFLKDGLRYLYFLLKVMGQRVVTGNR